MQLESEQRQLREAKEIIERQQARPEHRGREFEGCRAHRHLWNRLLEACTCCSLCQGPRQCFAHVHARPVQAQVREAEEKARQVQEECRRARDEAEEARRLKHAAEEAAGRARAALARIQRAQELLQQAEEDMAGLGT